MQLTQLMVELSCSMLCFVFVVALQLLVIAMSVACSVLLGLLLPSVL